MKSFSLLRLSALILFTLSALQAQEPGGDGGTSPAYVRVVREAMRSFTVRDFKSTLALVDKAEEMNTPTPITINIRAAVAIEEKRFPEGREYCLRALQMDSKFFPALFNLAEIPFVQGKYAEARLAYEKLLAQQPKQELVRFRILLTYLLEKNDERAKAELDEIPLLNDGPIYFYANAAWEFAHGNEEKAKSHIRSAEVVFPPIKTMNFGEVFYDLGWMKRTPPPGE